MGCPWPHNGLYARFVPPSEQTESAGARWGIAALSAFLFIIVAAVFYAVPGRDGAAHSPLLPTINAALNATAGICLLAGYAMVRRGRREAHRVLMLLSLGFSALFLAVYLLHHARVGSVRFTGPPAWRVVYLALLVPHIVLAAGMVPLALLTVLRAWRGRFAAHRAIARYTLPIWLFVSVSGVVVYVMLYHFPGGHGAPGATTEADEHQLPSH